MTITYYITNIKYICLNFQFSLENLHFRASINTDKSLVMKSFSNYILMWRDDEQCLQGVCYARRSIDSPLITIYVQKWHCVHLIFLFSRIQWFKKYLCEGVLTFSSSLKSESWTFFSNVIYCWYRHTCFRIVEALFIRSLRWSRTFVISTHYYSG